MEDVVIYLTIAVIARVLKIHASCPYFLTAPLQNFYRFEFETTAQGTAAKHNTTDSSPRASWPTDKAPPQELQPRNAKSPTVA
jgi:hypothetical protein